MMDKMTCRSEDPVVRRADGYFLYTADGRRFLDFFQDNGRAVLGHRLKGMQRIIKSTVSKGLLAPYPASREKKVFRALSMLFPDAVSFGVYADRLSLYKSAASMLGMPVEDISVSDPLTEKSGRITLWRPFLDRGDSRAPVEIPVLPFPGGMIPHVAVIYEKGLDPGEPENISPFLLDVLAATVHLLSNTAVPEDPDHYGIFDSDLWDRKGPYLIFRMERDDYEVFRGKSLDAGIFLPPSPDIPGIIPMRYEMGQIKKFLRVIKEMDRCR